MSLLMIDGFESEGNGMFQTFSANKTANTAYWAMDSGTKRTGTYSLRLGKIASGTSSAVNYYAYRDPTVSDNTMYAIGVAFRFSAMTATDRATNQDFIQIGTSDGKTVKVRYRCASDKKLELLNPDGSSMGVGYTYIAESTQYYLQIKVRSGVSGSVKMMIGNNVEFDLTNQLIATLNYKMNRVLFTYYSATYNSYPSYMNFDDIYILDMTAPMNDLLGVCQVYGARPDGLGDSTDFSHNSSSQYAAINEYVADGANYIYSDTSNRKSLFTLTDTTIAGSIKGIRVHNYHLRSDLGSGISKYKYVFRNVYDQEYETADVSVPGNTWLNTIWLYENDPILNQAQTNQKLNDLQVGFRISQID